MLNQVNVPNNVVNFKNNSVNYNKKQTPPMPADKMQQMDDLFIMQQQALRNAEKKEKSRDRWNKAGVLASIGLAVGVLGSFVLFVISNLIAAKKGGARKDPKMGDATVKFKKLAKEYSRR